MPQVFQYSVYLPSISDYVRMDELHNRDHLNILKYSRNNDYQGLSEYLEDLIISKIHNPPSRIHRIDKFCILLTMIMICIDPMITLQAKCETTEQDYELVIDVGDILNIISNVDYKDITVKMDNINISFSNSDEIYVSGTDEITQYINSVTIHNQLYDLSETTVEEFSLILDKLPGKSFAMIRDAIYTLKSRFDDIELLRFQSPYDEETPPVVLNIDLITNELFELIKTLFGQDLNGYYEMQFAMMSNYHFPPQYFDQCTPIESKIFYSYMKKDVDDRNSQLEKSQKATTPPTQGTG